MDTYIYEGPVVEFGRLVESDWKGKTVANSTQKAVSNLSYQWKKQRNRAKTAKISLPGRLMIEDYATGKRIHVW